MDEMDEQEAQPDPAPNLGVGGTLADAMGTLIHGDRWPEVRGRQKRIAEDELKAAKRRADLDAFGTAFAAVFLTCFIVLMVAGTGWILSRILG